MREIKRFTFITTPVSGNHYLQIDGEATNDRRFKIGNALVDELDILPKEKAKRRGAR